MPSAKSSGTPAPEDRKYWMSVLAKAATSALEDAWRDVDPKPGFTHLRRPETGLVMVQARAGGTGQRFNFGEMTVTRCSVALTRGANGEGDAGSVGHGYVAGADARHAELAAVFDAMLCDEGRGGDISERVIKPLAKALDERRFTASAKSAATKVDFFTLVRGEDD